LANNSSPESIKDVTELNLTNLITPENHNRLILTATSEINVDVDSDNIEDLLDQALAEADVCTRFVVPKTTPVPSFKMRFSDKKSRKQYSNETIAGKKGKKTGRWTRTEHLRFV